MSQQSKLRQLMTLTVGRELENTSRAQHTMLTTYAMLAALALCALWGIAVGSVATTLAVSNAYKVPFTVLLSALSALPAGIVALRLTNASLSGRELAETFATSIFGGSLVLATLAPIVAVYYHTSTKAGVPLAIGSVFVALATASLLFGRAVVRRLKGRPGVATSMTSVAILVTLFVLALMQFVALASPIIADPTRWNGGFDTVFGR
jgi:hypothetical protein